MIAVLKQNLGSLKNDRLGCKQVLEYPNPNLLYAFFCNKQYYKHCTIHDFSVVKKGYKNLKVNERTIRDIELTSCKLILRNHSLNNNML